MYDDDVVIKIKADIDARQTRQEFKKIAETSQTAVERSFKNLELTLRKSIEDVRYSMGKSLGEDEFFGDIIDKMADVNNYVREMGKLPKGMSSKFFDLERTLQSLINKYFELQEASTKVAAATTTTVDSKKYAEVKQQIRETLVALTKQRDRVEELEKDERNLVEIEKLLGDLRNRNAKGQKVIDMYEKRKAVIKELQAEYDKLRAKEDGVLIGPQKEAILQQKNAVWDQMKREEEAIDRYFSKSQVEMIQKIQELRAQTRDESLAGGIKYVTEELEKSNKQITELQAHLKELRSQRNAIPVEERTQTIVSDESSQEQVEAMRKLDSEIEDVEAQIISAATRMNELTDAAQRAGSSMSQWRNVVWSVSRVLGNVYTIGLDFARTAKSIANIYKTIWGYLKRIASIFTKLRDSIRGTAKEHAKSWKDMLRDVLRYSFGIRSLFALFRRLRRYIKEAFEEMAKQIPEVNKVLSELKSSLGMLKGSLATAFEPIISAVAPALNFLIEKLAQVMTYIGMFFAALTGRGYVYKATKSMQDFAKATKEANKQLQGFDELNNLTTNKDNGAEDAPMAIFKKVPVLDWIKDLADKIKAILMRILDPIKKAWARIGPYVEAAWRRAFYNVKKLLMDIGRDFLKAWDEMGQSISEHFLEIVGDVGNIIANIAEALDTAWNANENGYRIWKAILTLVDKVLVGIRNITTDMVIWTHDLDVTPAMTAFADWFESLEPIVEALMSVLFDFWDHALKPILTWAFDGENSGIARLFKILKDFNNKLDTTKIRANLDKVWQALGRFGQTVGEGLLIFLERMSDRIANWANSDKFENLCDSIVEFLDNIEPEDVADDLEQLLDTVLNLAGQVKDAIMFVVEHKDTILNILEFISEHLKGILFTLITFKTAIDFARLGANIFLMVTALEKVGGFSGAIAILTSKFQGLGAAISNIGFSNIISKFAGIFMFFEGVKIAITSFVDMWKNGWNVISSILEAFGLALAAIGAILLGAPALVAAVVASVVWIISQLVIYIHDHWEEIKEVVKVGLIVIQDWFNKLFENAKQKLQNFKENMKVVWQFIKEFIKGILQSIGQMIQNKINEWTNKLNEMKSKFSNSKLVSIASGGSPILNQISTRSASPVTRSVQSLNVPRLAQGAVIPPNKEFLAMLGDQKSGTNIESPLSTMVEAFNQAGGNRSEQELTLLQEQNQLLRQLIEKEWSISASQMFNAMQRQAVVYTKQSGKPAF